MSDQRRIEELQNASWQKGDATGWFEELYREAAGDKTRIPWSQSGMNPHLATHVPPDGTGRTAVVIGCGLGENAEFLATRGFAVTAFDISPTAVAWCRRQHEGSGVSYRVADLFTAASELGQFDFVLEAHTLQALPRPLRAQAVHAIAALVREELLVICRGCDEPSPQETIPWPLTRAELSGFAAAGLTQISFDDFYDQKAPPTRRFRIVYRRAYTK
jgi:2-polyprenyl-3-methyl-5-hydroxy-6-metoxy-1,4-benzoquinol methylase